MSATSQNYMKVFSLIIQVLLFQTKILKSVSLSKAYSSDIFLFHQILIILIRQEKVLEVPHIFMLFPISAATHQKKIILMNPCLSATTEMWLHIYHHHRLHAVNSILYGYLII